MKLSLWSGVAEQPFLTPSPVPVKVSQPATTNTQPPVSTQGNLNQGRKQSSQGERSAPSTPTPIKREKVDEPSGSVALGNEVKEEKDVKPFVSKWVPFEGGFTEEHERKWMMDQEEQVPEPQQEQPIKEEPLEVIDSVYFLRDEYNA